MFSKIRFVVLTDWEKRPYRNYEGGADHFHILNSSSRPFFSRSQKVKLLCYGVERCGRISQTLYDLRWRGGSLVLDKR